MIAYFLINYTRKFYKIIDKLAKIVNNKRAGWHLLKVPYNPRYECNFNAIASMLNASDSIINLSIIATTSFLSHYSNCRLWLRS